VNHESLTTHPYSNCKSTRAAPCRAVQYSPLPTNSTCVANLGKTSLLSMPGSTRSEAKNLLTHSTPPFCCKFAIHCLSTKYTSQFLVVAPDKYGFSLDSLFHEIFSQDLGFSKALPCMALAIWFILWEIWQTFALDQYGNNLSEPTNVPCNNH